MEAWGKVNGTQYNKTPVDPLHTHLLQGHDLYAGECGVGLGTDAHGFEEHLQATGLAGQERGRLLVVFAQHELQQQGLVTLECGEVRAELVKQKIQWGQDDRQHSLQRTTINIAVNGSTQTLSYCQSRNGQQSMAIIVMEVSSNMSLALLN